MDVLGLHNADTSLKDLEHNLTMGDSYSVQWIE